jgi:hypothetical protein
LKKQLTIALLMATLSVSPQALSAQVTTRDVFSQMPDSLLPYLTRNNRLDMMDFMDSNMEAEVKNSFDGNSEMTAMTDNLLTLQLSEASRVDLLLLPVSEPVDSASQVICMIRTFGSSNSIRESVLEFYSVKWNALPSAQYFPQPAGIYSAQWDAESQELTLTSDTFLESAANEEQKAVEKTLIKLGWSGRFHNKY